MKSLNLLCAAALLGLSGLSGANTVTNWGTLNAPKSAFDFVAPGSFLDIYSFNLVSESDLTTVYSAAVADNLGMSFDISGGQVALYSGTWDGNPADATLEANYHFDGTTGDTVHSGVFDSGNYFYAVLGNADGAAGGAYLLESAAVAMPVPETETYAMMFLGMGALVAGARWRNRA